MLLVPSLGRVLDRTWRPYGLGAMVALQDVSILASCVVLIIAAARPAASAVPLVDTKLFVALVLLSMVERLSSAVSEMLIERDWVPQIAGAVPGDRRLRARDMGVRRTLGSPAESDRL